MNPSSAANLADLQTLSYEQALDELEAIVASLEANQKSLDESIALYERGQALALHCAGLLDRAELRVRQLSAHDLNRTEESEVD